jgi:signal transduction histidine kinase
MERQRILILLVAATLIPLGALAWLGVRLLAQERDVERQRRREGLELAAGRLAIEIDRRLRDIEEGLARGEGIRLLPTGLASNSGPPILYQPVSPPEPVSPSGLAAAEAAEFQRRDLEGVTAAYRRLAASRDPAQRAAALVGLGRVLRQRGARTGALRAYSDLEALGTTLVGGQPAGLVARQGRCKVFEEAGDREGLQRAAEDLGRALETGGWPIDRATFDLYRDLLGRWGARAPAAQLIVRTEAAVDLWQAWRRNDLAPRGRRVIRTASAPLLAIWTGGLEGVVASFTTTSELETWLSMEGSAPRLTAAIVDLDGEPLAGVASSGAISLTPGETRLPFVLRASAEEAPSGEPMRRLVVLSTLIATSTLMFAAALGVYRAAVRESNLARQQADFVSAVSHEFRTPLTSMRHLTELLTSRSVTSDDRKAHYYQLLANETERLHRMVESLLSFGRIEAGAYAWQLEPLAAADLVRAILDEFRQEPSARHRTILFDAMADVPPINADREALSRAVWNLLENAVKYSQAPAPIRVSVASDGGWVMLSVDDRGIGIPPAERERIFEKFVRGGDASRAGIRGIGIGLTLVKSIAEAHGGAVRVDSHMGVGSTFTIALPVMPRPPRTTAEETGEHACSA